MTRALPTRLLIFAIAATVHTTCTSSNPAAPTTPPPAASVPESGLKANQPTPLSPTNDELVRSYTLSAGAAAMAFANANLMYRFQVFGEDGDLVQDSGLVASTQWTPSVNLDRNERHTWRVRAEFGADVTPWASATFITPEIRGTDCGPPANFQPLDIISCHRAKYPGHMDAPEFVALLRGVALDFNVAGVAGGPFGILVKTGGNNCDGYSCDIICAEQGSAQDQWDILLDETYPQWGGEIPNVRADVCEIQYP